MADIRIKDLPTTATQTSSDDFIALDGTVNGTRKLSAYNPSFGGAITGVSLTAPTTTNLTLAGGSTGASLVLGQGANGAATLALPGTGGINVTGSVAGAASLRTSMTNSNAGGFSDAFWFNDSSRYVGIQTGGSTVTGTFAGLNRANIGKLVGNVDNLAIGTEGTLAPIVFVQGTTAAEKMRLSTGSNLLIGGTTDIAGSGGLKVFGTTTAVSTTSGALQVAGGVGVAGASYFGSNLLVGASGKIQAGGTTEPGKVSIFQSDTKTYSTSTANDSDFWAVRVNASTLANQVATMSLAASADNGTTAGRGIISAIQTASGTNTGILTFQTNTAGTTSETMRMVSGNLLIGTTTDGGQKLQVNGTASFAGAVTTANKFAVSAYASNSFLTGNGSGFLDNYYNGGSGFDTMSLGVNYDRRNNAISSAIVATGDLRFEQGTGGQSNFVIALGGTNTVPTDRFTIASTGNATFAGAVAINNTVATAVAVASTHKVTMVIGGVTYYLLASNV